MAQTGNEAIDLLIVYGVLGVAGFVLWHLIRLASPPLVFAVFRRNIVSYFSNPIAYLFIIAFSLVGAYFAFWHKNKFFADNICDLAQLNEYFPLILLFFIPAITMSIWAEERKSGTEELLLTLPGSDLQIVLGKYLASLAIYTVALAFLGILYFVLEWLGDPDGGLILTNFLGYWLVGAAMLSAGMVASLLTSNVTVAFILGALFSGALIAPDYLQSGITLNRGFQALLSNAGVVQQFESLSRGVIPLGSIVYFVAVTVVMLYLNVVLLSRRHWEGSEQSGLRWLHYGLRAAALGVVAVSLTLVARTASSWAAQDATAERLHTLSPDTKKILAGIDPKRPVLIEAFISPDPPKEYVKTRRDLIDLLERFKSIAGSKIQLDIHDTEPFSNAAKDAERIYQIKAEQVPVEEDSRRGLQQLYMGVAFKSGLNEKVIPFVWQALPVEYELARSIRSVSEVARKKVGILTTDAKLFGEFDMQMFQMGRTPQDWLIIKELEQQYDVVRVSPDSDPPADVNVLIVPMASSLTDPEIDRLTAYIKSGRPALILDDPMPLVNPGLAAQKPKQPPRSPMMGMPPQGTEPKGNLTKLTRLLNLSFNSRNVVWQQWNPVADIEDLPLEYVFVGPGSGNPDAFNKDESITSGLQQLLMFLPGSIQPLGGDGPTFTPLLTTGSRVGTEPYDDIIKETMFGGAEFNPRPRRSQSSSPLVLAALIRGKPAGTEAASASDEKKPPAEAKDMNVIFVTDLDMMSDMLFQLRQRETKGSLRFDNVTFLLNCVDYLAGDKGFLALRKKRPLRRPLSRIDDMVKDGERQEMIRISEAQDNFQAAIDQAQKKLNEEVDKIKNDPTIPAHLRDQRMALAESYWNKEFERKKDAEERSLNDHLRQIRDEGKRERREQERRVKWAAVLLPPIPALLIGLVVLLVRLSGEKAGVDPKRLV